MNAIVGCEYSGEVRDALIAEGVDAISCDFLETEKPGPHHQGELLAFLNGKSFDLGIFHPSCTYLCNSGVRWLWNKDGSRNEERWAKMVEGALFFKSLLALDMPLAIENPIMHKYALEIIGRKYDQIIQPYQFGHTTSKATCLWLKGLPLLTHTHN